MLRPLLVFLLFLAPLAAAAQDPAIEWGRLSDAEKALDAVDDPDAHAVVLGDVGLAELELRRGQGLEYRLKRHKRVKILDEAGYAQGEFAFVYSDDDRFRRVRGQTFVPDGSGDYRRVELDRDDIFDEEVRPGVREVRFSMPALAPGAIVEIEYLYETPSITVLPDWYFQASEPTLVSEYRLKLPVYFEYMTVKQGLRAQQMETQQIKGFDYDAGEFRWVARDLPAIRDEPYTTTEADHLERIGFQLRRVQRPDGFTDNVLRTWEEVAQVLADHDNFGRRVTGSRAIRALAEQATAGLDDEADRAEAIYDLLRTDFVWDGDRGVFGMRDPDAVVESRSGDAAELAHLLLALYDAAGIEAHPVLLSSRPNGRPYQNYPFVDQFDTILVAPVVRGAGLTLLDPTSPHRPYGQVDARNLNGDAWLVDPARPRWVPVRPSRGSATTTHLRGALAADGTLTADVDVQLKVYDAFDARVRLAEAAAENATEEAVSTTADAADDTQVEVVEVTALGDVAEDLEIAATLTATAGEVVGDEMYVSPFVAMRLDENPFQREARSFPVDYPHPFTRTYVAEIEVPEGWEAVDLPPALSLAIPSRKVRYQRFAAADGGRLLVRAVLTVTGGEVAASEYPDLRQLYDEIVATEAEALVLARTAAPADAAAPSDPADGSAEAGEADGR